MIFERISVSPKDYVVLDVETSGLTIDWDLLSISIYKPDDNKTYNRFLPLEQRNYISSEAKRINGIDEKSLCGLTALTQDEVDSLIEEFKLDKRIILHYGDIDRKFLKNYFSRHKLNGFERMHFFNFKKLICSHRFPKATISKDNLCRAFNIEGVTETHSGINDCMLEWKLFKKLNGLPVLAKNGYLQVELYHFSPEYLIPASYFQNYPNLVNNLHLPNIECETKEVFSFCITNSEIQYIPKVLNGIIVESLINNKVNVICKNNKEFNLNNSRKLQHIGCILNERLETIKKPITFDFNEDKTILIREKKYKEIEEIINASIKNISSKLTPITDYIKTNIFKNSKVYSQEQVINNDYGVIASCDLSNSDCILEIKCFNINVSSYKYQLFFEANGRKVFLLSVTPIYNKNTEYSQYINFSIYEISFITKEAKPKELKTQEKLQKRIGNNISIEQYTHSKKPIIVKCNKCGFTWKTTYNTIMFAKRFCCKNCEDKTINKTGEASNTIARNMSSANNLYLRAQKYAKKIDEKSNGKISVNINDYLGSKQNIKAKCTVCGCIWNIRADHLLDRCWCPICRPFQKSIINSINNQKN